MALGEEVMPPVPPEHTICRRCGSPRSEHVVRDTGKNRYRLCPDGKARFRSGAARLVASNSFSKTEAELLHAIMMSVATKQDTQKYTRHPDFKRLSSKAARMKQKVSK